MLNKKIKCPKCGSENVVCMDGRGAVSKYGDNVMIDIAPDIWLCKDCKESFRINYTEELPWIPKKTIDSILML